MSHLLERLFWWATLNDFELKDPARCASIASMTAHARQQKITFGEMRGSGVDRVLIYCADYRCSHSIEMSAAGWPDQLRVSDIEHRFVCTACGKRGADIRPNFRPAKMGTNR